MKRVSTSRAVKDAEKVINEALSGEGVITVAASSNKKESGNKTGIYNHFMNGVTYMLPLVIAGGILIACSFAFGIHAADPTDPSYNQLAEALSTIGGSTAFALMVPALAAGIAIVDGSMTINVTKQKDPEWIISNFDKQLTYYLSIMLPLRAKQELLSQELKQLGLSRNVHKLQRLFSGHVLRVFDENILENKLKA